MPTYAACQLPYLSSLPPSSLSYHTSFLRLTPLFSVLSWNFPRASHSNHILVFCSPSHLFITSYIHPTLFLYKCTLLSVLPPPLSTGLLYCCFVPTNIWYQLVGSCPILFNTAAPFQSHYVIVSEQKKTVNTTKARKKKIITLTPF